MGLVPFNDRTIQAASDARNALWMASPNPCENPLISGKNKNRPGFLPQKVTGELSFSVV
jgi:hypothetical protein